MNDPALEPVVAEFIRENNLDTLEGAFAYTGGEDLEKPGLHNRRRTRLRIRDNENRCWELYLKRYGKAPLLSRLWLFLTGRRSRCEAQREFFNIESLRRAGLPTMRQLAWGRQSGLLGTVRSYILVTAVPGEAMERAGKQFVQQNIKNPKMLEQMTDELARITALLHGAGFVHRDLYASHVFLHDHEGCVKLYLIDLARAFQPSRRKFRWRVKDLAQLKFSMPWAWITSCWPRFLQKYLDDPQADRLARWQKAIDRRVARMETQQRRRAARVSKPG